MRRPPTRLRPLALALAALLALPTTARSQAAAPGDRVHRVAVDSAAAIVVTVTPTGIAEVRAETRGRAYAVAGDTASVRAWAEAAARLVAPKTLRRGAVDYHGVMVRDDDGATLRLVRLTVEGRAVYELAARDGRHRASLRLEWPAWAALYLALTGADPARPAATLDGEPAYHEFQVARPATPHPQASPAPTYPPALRRRGVEGEVHFEVVVGRDGRPRMDTFLVLDSADPAFSAAVRQAVERWRWEPALRDGQPVAQMVYASVPFRTGGTE